MLHHEVRGSGPAVLFVGGLDGGTFEALARIVEQDGFTTISYDRRGHSRSARPDGGSATTLREQAQDAASLLAALGIERAAIVGNSIGAQITLELALREPALVSGAVLLDPAPLPAVLGDLARSRPPSTGDLRKDYETFLRFVGAWPHLDDAARERLLGNADVFFRIDMPALGAFVPDEALLATNAVPILVCAGEQSQPPPRQMAVWLAARLRTEVTQTPGGHVGYLARPDDVARTILPFLHRAGQH